MAGIPPRCKRRNTYDKYVPRKGLSCLHPLNLNAPGTVSTATAETADVMRYVWMGPDIRIMQQPDYGHDRCTCLSVVHPCQKEIGTRMLKKTQVGRCISDS